MAENLATVVNWYGPYTGSTLKELLAAARRAADEYYDYGLYAAIGLEDGRPGDAPSLLYMGVGNPLYARLSPSHHKIGKVALTGMWLGEPSVAGIPGRRRKKINPHLDIVEWATAYFLELSLNEKKRRSPPQESCVILNRWYGTDYDTPAERPVAGWADVIEFEAGRRTANLVWFGKQARVEVKEVVPDAPARRVRTHSTT